MLGHQLEASSPNLSRSHDAKRCSQKHASGSTEDNFQDLPGGAVSLYIPSPSIWDLIQVWGPQSINSDRENPGSSPAKGWDKLEGAQVPVITDQHIFSCGIQTFISLNHCYLFCFEAAKPKS